MIFCSNEMFRVVILLAGLVALIIVFYIRWLKEKIEEGKQAKQINDTLFRISNAVNVTDNLKELYATIHATLSGIMDIRLP